MAPDHLPPATVSYGEVKQAEARARDAMLEVVVRVLGLHASTNAADTSARAHPLAPILLQNEKIGEAFQRRRGLIDVNPNSGQEEAEFAAAGAESDAGEAAEA